MGWADYKMKVKSNEVMQVFPYVTHTVLCTGPNFICHVDGYDKLKPFGLCFHGAIDGYDRRLMWLEVGATKNDPDCIPNYYLNVFNGLSELIVVLTICILISCNPFFVLVIKTQCRTSNVSCTVKSIANQRIVAWWSYLKRQDVNWLINKLEF